MIRIFLFLAVLFSATAVHAEKRVAFLVGNAAYDHAPDLDNPIRDTELIASTLVDLDFEVSMFSNLDRDQIGRELSLFLKNTEGADVTLFYFAGHGLQYDGQNYLVGIDAKLETEFDISSEALDLSKVIELLERNSRAALVFIDACRDNPLANAFYAQNFSQTRALTTRGLAPMTRSFQGSMITFSASPGQVAYDGTGANSPFAAALARHLPTENLEVLSLMKRVIRDVKTETGDLQTPMVTNDLTAEIYMRLGGGEGAVLALQQEEAFFEAASEIGTLRAWDIYLSRFPSGQMRDMALAAREALQVQEISKQADVEIADLTPQVIARDIVTSIETNIGLDREDNRAVQSALNALGYDAGPEDGIMGQRTRQAIANFQAAAGMSPTGVISVTTAAELGLELSRTEESSIPIIASLDARKYDPDQIALVETDERLHKAIRALSNKELVYGFYQGRIYIGVLNWAELSFERASAIAKRAGGHLATMTSAAENDFVFNLVRHDERFWRQSHYKNHNAQAQGPNFGLFQPENAREPAGGWQWVTGEPLEYTNWDPYAPNNVGNEDYARFLNVVHENLSQTVPPAPYWDDQMELIRSFIIEIE